MLLGSDHSSKMHVAQNWPNLEKLGCGAKLAKFRKTSVISLIFFKTF
jgi:hypothetical protein